MNKKERNALSVIKGALCVLLKNVDLDRIW